MQRFLSTFRQALPGKILTLALAIFMQFSGLFFVSQPSYAAAASLSDDDKIERAYDGFSEGTGIAEEVYQQRLKEGENPEKMPKPYRRIVDLEGKEVPETSFVEKSVSQAKQLVEKVTGKE